MTTTVSKILIGNSFPMSLIRRKVTIEPTLVVLNKYAVTSFWGHDNTVVAASDYLGVDLTPKEERPVIILNKEGYPTLYGELFKACWIVSPTYKKNFRPAIGEEVDASTVQFWTTLKITWE